MPREFMLVYAPRDEAEVDVVSRIIVAGVWWASGIDVNGYAEGSRRQSADVAAIGKAMEGNECWVCKAHGCGSKVEKMMSDA